MDVETTPDQREQRPAAAAAPRGRPFVKGQSGNPAGRPSRAYTAAYVAGALIANKTVPLTRKLIDLALAGDHAALRMCLDRIAPPRRETPAWLPLPPMENRGDICEALKAVADAAAAGVISSTHSAELVRMLVTVLYAI
jgi:hypothetical protein